MTLNPRLYLKQYTAKTHDTLEKLPCHIRLLAPNCQQSDYVKVLAGYARAIAAVEPLLLAVDWGSAPAYQPRLLALQQDLLRLESVVTPISHSSRNHVYHPWGLRYVIDGMTLGARWMAKHTSLLSNSEWQFATSFFTLTEVQWPQFCQSLDNVVTDEQVLESIADSANAMFELFLQELTQP